MVWLARAKTTHYSPIKIAEAKEAGEPAVEMALAGEVNPVSGPPTYKIERWWSERARSFLRHLRAAIAAAAAGRKGPVEDLLNLAFCRTLIKLSNAAFNHQSMSFRNPAQCKLDLESGAVFFNELAFVLAGAERNPLGDAAVILGDARNLPACLRNRFDVVVTSPPALICVTGPLTLCS